MQITNIKREIREMIADCVGRGEVRDVSYYVNHIMAQYSDIEGSDVDFYLICTRHRIKDIVSATIGKFEPKQKQSTGQLVLDGFEHLQIAYTFEREGRTVLVPIDKCTDLELMQRAKEYDDMAKGCQNHARELRGYVSDRSGQVA
jgi:hypothetical protein